MASENTAISDLFRTQNGKWKRNVCIYVWVSAKNATKLKTTIFHNLPKIVINWMSVSLEQNGNKIGKPSVTGSRNFDHREKVVPSCFKLIPFTFSNKMIPIYCFLAEFPSQWFIAAISDIELFYIKPSSKETNNSFATHWKLYMVAVSKELHMSI